MIEIKNLNFKYKKHDELVLKNINFEMNQGEIFGLLGPSGAGKSTTQKIITGILKDYEGSVRIFNQEVKNHTASVYEHIGVSFELPNLYTKFTALENLNFFKGMYKAPTKDPSELLDMVGLSDVRDTYVRKFSKGMKMRLNFCRAFLNDPKILFLDEPTSGLDPRNAQHIKNIILKQKELGKTIFLTTHNMTLAEQICDRVAFIVDGEIRLIDTPRNLKVQRGQKQFKIEYRKNHQLKEEVFEMKNIGHNKDYLRIIQTHHVERMHTLDASLEEIFIQVTGRALSCD